MTAALVLMASACSTTERAPPAPVIKTVFVKPDTPAVAKVPCARPVAMPVPRRKLTDKETRDWWDADRDALTICEYRRAAAVAAAE